MINLHSQSLAKCRTELQQLCTAVRKPVKFYYNHPEKQRRAVPHLIITITRHTIMTQLPISSLGSAVQVKVNKKQNQNRKSQDKREVIQKLYYFLSHLIIKSSSPILEYTTPKCSTRTPIPHPIVPYLNSIMNSKLYLYKQILIDYPATTFVLVAPSPGTTTLLI